MSGAQPAAAERVVGGRYRLDSLIGRGGMGQVWQGTDLRLGRQVAVKLLRDDFVAAATDGQPVTGSLDLADQQARFARECRVTARLDHPGLVTVFDAGTEGRHHYLVMQLVEGLPLADLIAESDPLSCETAVAVAAQLCAALAVVHAVPVVHRDLKPSNVMVRPDGRVVLLDLGIASAFEPELSTLTRTGHPLGTPAYMAPEQALTGESDARSDLYSLGCTLYAVLTGEAPFRGPTPLAVMDQHVRTAPRPVRELRPDVPVELERLLALLLAKDPAGRPGSAQEVYRLLLPLLPRSSDDAAAALRRSALPDPARPFRHPSAPPPSQAPSQAPSPSQAPARDAVAAARVTGPDPAEAAALASELSVSGRFGEAAELLASSLPRAVAERGAADPEVHQLQRFQALLLVRDGQFRRAYEEYRSLAEAEAEAGSGGRTDAAALEWWFQAAECLEPAGEPVSALAEYRAVLAGYERRRAEGLPTDPERLYRVRQRIGELLARTGDPAAAQRLLIDLWLELEREYGPHHPRVVELRRVLDGLRSAAPGQSPAGFGPPPPTW